MTVTFSLALLTSGRSRVRVGGLGLGLCEVVGETESFDGRLDDVVEEGVTGRPAGLVALSCGAGGFRDRKGEMEDVDLWDLVELLADIAVKRERERARFESLERSHTVHMPVKVNAVLGQCSAAPSKTRLALLATGALNLSLLWLPSFSMSAECFFVFAFVVISLDFLNLSASLGLILGSSFEKPNK